MCIKKLSILVTVISVIAVFTNDVKAKSVYAIIDHGYGGGSGDPAKISAYGIDGTQIEQHYVYQLDEEDYPTGPFFGPVGIAEGADHLFVTHEDTGNGIGGIQVVNARTMLDEGIQEISGHPDLAGIVYDHDNDMVYAIERETDDLYVLTWDPCEETLTLQGGGPKTLSQIGENGCGLALDEVENVLYVTSIGSSGQTPGHGDVSHIVHYYDANDPNWTHLGTIEIEKEGTEYNAVGVAVYNNNAGTRYLYTGAYALTGSHQNLVRTDLDLYDNDPTDPNSIEYEDIGASVIGLDVDQDTGLVYITTSDNTIQVWNTDLPFGLGWAWTDRENEGIQGPAGICLGQTDFVPPFGIDKQDDLNENECVVPEDEITYVICYEYQWTEDNDPDPNQFASVTIVDYLPKEVDFVQADPNNGVYSSTEHTYTWTIDQDSFGDPNCVKIVVKVNKSITPGEPIENSVVEIISSIEGQEYNDSDIIETAACDCSQK